MGETSRKWGRSTRGFGGYVEQPLLYIKGERIDAHASPSNSENGSLEAERCSMYFSDSRVSGFSGEHRSSEVQNEPSYGFALC